MKKLITIFFISMLLLCAQSSTAETVDGEWYGSLNGLPMCLVLENNDEFILSTPGQEPISGTWKMNNGFVVLNAMNQRIATIAQKGSVLIQSMEGIVFTREQSDGYTPSEQWNNNTPILYSGYWKSAYVDMAGTAVPAFALEDETDLYVEGHSAILGGPILGDVIVKLVEQDGKLVTEEGVSPSAELVLQQDGLLRLIVTGSDTAPQTWYLLRSYSSILDSAEAEAETAE